MDMIGIILLGAFIAALAVALVGALYLAGRDEFGLFITEADKAKKREEDMKAKMKYRLVVGKEYLVKISDRETDEGWHTLVYMGKDLDGWRQFYNLETGKGIRFKRANPEQLFRDNEVRNIYTQSPIPDRHLIDGSEK